MIEYFLYKYALHILRLKKISGQSYTNVDTPYDDNYGVAYVETMFIQLNVKTYYKLKKLI